MVRVTLSLSRYPYSYEVEGHCDYVKSGPDIVCAAVSALCQTAVLGLKNVAGIPVKFVSRDGFLSVALPKSVDAEKQRSARIILMTLKEGLKDIQSGYPDLIEIKEY